METPSQRGWAQRKSITVSSRRPRRVKTIASVSPGTFKSEREGVEHKSGRHSNVCTVDDPPEAIAQRFENLSIKGIESSFFNRSNREEHKYSKLVWVRKEDVRLNDDLNGPQSPGN